MPCCNQYVCLSAKIRAVYLAISFDAFNYAFMYLYVSYGPGSLDLKL